MSYGKALYFPYVHFRDENWLKYALLYWDGVKRITPSSYQPEDSETVKLLVTEGLVESVAPDSYTKAIEQEFIPALAESRRMLIEENLVIADNLTEAGLAKRFHMAEDLWRYYMFCLAAHISEKQNAPMLSDSFEMEAAGTYFQHLRSSGPAKSADDDVGFRLARMVLPVPRPNHLSEVPMKRFLRFHRTYEAERMQFRTAIEKLTEDATALDDATAIRDLLEQQKKTIANALADQRKIMDELGVETAMSLMAVSAPTGAVLVGGALSHFDPIMTSVASGVTLALSFVGWTAKIRQAKRKAIRNCDWHYLLRVEKSFDVRTVANELGNSFRGFVLD